MSAPRFLKPFWRYYGGKWRAAPRYPAPRHDWIIEPFAGAAGYSLRYYQRKIVLVEKYPVVAEIWRYLTRVRSSEILSIPLVEHVDDLPSWCPQGARYLVGFAMNAATVSPCRQLSSGRRKLRDAGRVFEGWSEAMRARVAEQVNYIRHWLIFENEYDSIDLEVGTWFVDPPYQKAGKYYVHGSALLDYTKLSAWCQTRRGQTIVCENVGADWLPFVPYLNIKAANMVHSSMRDNQNHSAEAIWLRDS